MSVFHSSTNQLVTAVTFGASIAACESAFVCLIMHFMAIEAADVPCQEEQSSVLAYDKWLTNNIDMGLLIDKFHVQSWQLFL